MGKDLIELIKDPTASNIEKLDNILKIPESSEKISNKALQLLLTFAIKGNQSAIVLKILENPNITLDFVDENGNSPLMLAIATHQTGLNDELIINNLLSNGADVNQTNQYGVSALEMAVKKDNTKIARILLGYKANVNHIDSEGQDLLTWLAKNKRFAMASLLINHEADITKDFMESITLQELVMHEDGIAVMQALLERFQKGEIAVIALLSDKMFESAAEYGGDFSSFMR